MNINTIARFSADIKKPNKIAAFEQLKELIENSDESQTELLANLYTFFTPAITKPKTAFQWVSKAKGIKGVHYYLNFTYSDGTRVLATDGHRAHIVESTDLKEGFYDNNGFMAHDTSYGKFPNIDQITPDVEDCKPIKLNELELIDVPNTTMQAYRFNNERGFNAKYIREALSFGDMDMFIEGDKMLLIAEGRKAVIMAIIL